MAEIVDLEPNPKPKGWPRPLLIAIGITLVAGLWTAIACALLYELRAGVPAISAASTSDLATLVFGVSGVSLAIFSLLVGGIAIAGWSTIKQSVRKEIEESLRGSIDALGKELRGRQLAGVGMVLGLFYARTSDGEASEKAQDEQARLERSTFLAEMIQHCWQAYRMLKETNSVGQYMALNNFVYFSCIQRDPGTHDLVLRKARELKVEAEERSYWEALLTYCLAIDKFSQAPEEIEDARRLANGLEKKAGLTERQKGEAAAIAASLATRLKGSRAVERSRSQTDR